MQGLWDWDQRDRGEFKQSPGHHIKRTNLGPVMISLPDLPHRTVVRTEKATYVALSSLGEGKDEKKERNTAQVWKPMKLVAEDKSRFGEGKNWARLGTKFHRDRPGGSGHIPLQH